MGSEHSRLSSSSHTNRRKRLSLPSHLASAQRSVSCELSSPTPGSSSSAPPSDSHPNCCVSCGYPAPKEQFTEFEQDVLLSTWPLIAADKLTHGSMVIENAHRLFPGLDKFLPVSIFGRANVGQHPRAKQHILTFMQVLEDAIEALNGNWDECYERLILLGARHATIPGMKLEYFKVFKQAILTTWDSLMYEEFTDDVRRAWAHLLDCIIHTMCEGCLVFEEEEDKMICSGQLPHRASDSQLEQFSFTRRRSGRPSVVNMTHEELLRFYSNWK
ncbi:unnamed protein product [Dicrocoelium dendriticum]|nr:unnamed protein product [Dicrocoelium dendriticum]